MSSNNTANSNNQIYTGNKNQRLNKTKDLTISALMAAAMCILCPVSIPIGPIPVSLQIFMCLLAVEILGTKRALTSFLVYLLLGAVGLPVFSGYQGGLAKLTGPTGGYIIGFIFTILISGVIIDHIRSLISQREKVTAPGRQGDDASNRYQGNVSSAAQQGISQAADRHGSLGKMILPLGTAAAMILGIAAAYFFGTIWFIQVAKCDLMYALSVCVIPFIPLDLMKMIAAILVGSTVRRALERAFVL